MKLKFDLKFIKIEKKCCFTRMSHLKKKEFHGILEERTFHN